MSEKYFNFSDVLGYGWRVAISNIGFFIGLLLLYAVILYSPAIAEIIVRRMHLSNIPSIYLVISLKVIGQIIAIFLGIGAIKIVLAFCNEQKPTIGTLFNAADCFWRYLGTAILYGLIVLGGFLLLIVPGIIWAIKFKFCYYFVIDKGMGPIDALKASSKTTMGAKWNLFAFDIIGILIIYAGILCLLVGLFVAVPIIMVANALIYRQLATQTPELQEFGINIPDSQPVSAE